MKIPYLILLSFLLIQGIIIPARGQNINPASVNVNELSDSQIDKIIKEIQSRGFPRTRPLLWPKHRELHNSRSTI